VSEDDDPGTLFDEGDVLNMSSTFVPSKGQVIITYSDEDTDNSHHGKYIVVTNPSGLTVEVTDPVTFESAHTELTAVVFDTNSERAVVAYQDQGNSDFLTANILIPGGANLTSENYIGIARSGAADGAGAIIDTQGAVADNVSGLTAGQSYFVQKDGTLGETAATPSVFAGTAVSATKLIVKG